MAKIKIRHNHTDSKTSAREKVEQALAPHVAKFGLKKTWKGDKLLVKGKGIDGVLNVSDGDVDIDMKLSFPASMVAAKIEDELKSELKKSFS